MKYVAFITKGLEEISKSELIKNLSDFKEVETKDKRIIFKSEAQPESLIKLTTIDDIGIYVTKVDEAKTIDIVGQSLIASDLQTTYQLLNNFRSLNETFSLTVGVSGSPLDSKGLTSVLKDIIEQKYQWIYTELDHSNFDIRIFIDHSVGIVSVRITKDSIHHRTYKTTSKAGSLKPTIAASMIQLATNSESNLKIVDNFCGSGTILCEALIAGNEVFGGDIDPESIQIAKNNLSNLKYNATDKVKQLDATKTGWQNSYFDCAISNLPWDKQIEVSSITTLYEGTIREYAGILKPGGTLCALVSKPDLFIKYTKKYFPDKKISQLKIGLLGQTPSIILAK